MASNNKDNTADNSGKTAPSNPYASCKSSTTNKVDGAPNTNMHLQRPPTISIDSKKAPKTASGYRAALKYVNDYLQLKKLPPFEQLTDTHVEGDHLSNYLENIYYWLATTNFKTNEGFMMQSGKETKFDQIKVIFKEKFKTHTLWNDTEYFKTTKKWFRKKC